MDLTKTGKETRQYAFGQHRRQIEARILVSGLSKGEYYRQSLLHQQISITVGKYQSDRLSLEIRKLRERIEALSISIPDESDEVLQDCKALLEALVGLIGQGNERMEK